MRIRSRAKHRIRRKKLGRPFWRLWSGFTLASSGRRHAGRGASRSSRSSSTRTRWPSPAWWRQTVSRGSCWPCPPARSPTSSHAGPSWPSPTCCGRRPSRSARYLILGGHIDLATLILIVLVNASGRAIYYSSLQAVVPDIVPSDALEYSNGVLVGTETGAETLAGPVVGTWFFAMNKALPFFTDAIALVLSCIPSLRLPIEGSRIRRVDALRLGGRPDPLGRPPPALPDPDGGVAGRPAGDGDRCPRAPRHDRVGGRHGRLRALPRRRRRREASWAAWRRTGWCRRFKSAQTLIAAGVVSGVGYLVMAAANGWQLAGPAFAVVGFAAGTGRRRVHRPAPAADAPRGHGPGRRRIPRHRLGRRPCRRPRSPGASPPSPASGCPWCWPGALQCVVAVVLARPLLRASGRTPRRRVGRLANPLPAVRRERFPWSGATKRPLGDRRRPAPPGPGHGRWLQARCNLKS